MSDKQKEGPMDDFKLPPQIIDNIFDLSGSADHFKGVVICVCSPKGFPMIFAKYDSPVTELGMRKAMEVWLMAQDETDGGDASEVD